MLFIFLCSFLSISRVLQLIHLRDSQCWRVVFQLLCLTHKVNHTILMHQISWVLLHSSFFHLRMVPSFIKRDCPGFYCFVEISTPELDFKRFSCSSELFFSYFCFISVCLMVTAWAFPSFKSLCCFPDLVVLSLPLLLFLYFSLWASHIFNDKFYSSYLAIYSYCLS